MTGCRDVRHTHADELLVPFERRDVERGLPFRIRPVEDVGIAVDIHAGHAEGSPEKVLVGRPGSMWR